MALAGRVTKIPDSEDEPFTSSPEALPDDAISQLDGTAEERPQDAPSRGGGFPNLLKDTDMNKAAEYTASTCNDEQQVALDGVHSLGAVARANPESDMLQQYANELEISHQNVSSLTDSCDSSNQHASAPTNSSSLHPLNKQGIAAETAPSGSEKEQIIPADESALNPAVKTPNAASSSTCANHDSTTTDIKLFNYNDQLVLPPVEDAIHPAYSGIAAAVSALEGGLPDTQPTGQDPTGRLSVEGAPSSQPGHPKEPHLSSYAGESGPQNNSIDSGDTKGRGCSCPPSLSPAESSSSSNDHAPRRSTTAYAATLTKQKTQHGEREVIGSLELPRSMDEDSVHPSVSTADNSNISLCDITMEHIDQDLSMKSVQPSPVPKQQPLVESVGERNPQHSQLIVNANLASSPGSSDKPAVQHEVHVSEAVSNEKLNIPPLEAASTTLQKLNEVQEAATNELRNQNGVEHTGLRREADSSAVVEVAVTESTLNAVTQTPSSAVFITEDPQLTPAKSPQEITLAELKAKRAALIASLTHLPAIQDLLADARTSGVSSQMSNAEPAESEIMAAAHQIHKKHIKLLHEYNEIKDVGQGLMGLIADQRGVRIMEVQDDFGVSAKD
ncbi:hypothetical protein P171DRAFT_430613 [Karstenula rhodostoma CBS 690.94]|uniref:Swi5-domain-containing protein n=1 Tax=Karstenula rhodostoma CBS 690.94 TaxID=1392251 RepID=A0A9P4PLZ3_9PLEO|nr:hypothetical protein P171DRAFT_430613 [Karstenula rhodostoma CBS 690.94]